MWILFASLNPISEGIRSLFIKKASKEVDPIVISWANNLIPAFSFTALLFFVDIKFTKEFWIGLIGSGLINVVSNILYMRSISKGDISSVMPMLSFTPLFLLISSPIMIGEFPRLLGLVGILFVVVGSYLLNLNMSKKNILEPFKSLVKNKGTRYMLIVAFLWAISAGFDKMAIRTTSVWQYIAFVNVLIFSLLSLIAILSKKITFASIKKGKKNLILISCLTTGSYIFHMTALSLTLAAYVVALKRMSIIISVILGSRFLNEPNILERLLGAIVMVVGVILIVLSQ